MQKANKTKKIKPSELTHLNPECCGIDVGAKELFVAIANNASKQEVRSFTTFTRDLNQMIDWLRKSGVKKHRDGINGNLLARAL